MKKSKIITTSLLIFVIAIIIPIVMNYILIGSVGAKVTGESKDWLSFFGSYLGGVFTAYISFIILSKTINHNIAIFDLQQKKQDLESLKRMLSEQVSTLDFARVGTIVLVITDSSQYQSEIQKLDIFQRELTLRFNSYKLFYENSKEQPVKDYWDSYQRCVSKLFDDITEMTRLIAELPPYLDDMMVAFMKKQVEDFYAASKSASFAPPCQVSETISEYQIKLDNNNKRQRLITEINALVCSLGEHKKEYTEDTFRKAQLWIQAEEMKLNNIMNS